MGCNGSTAAGGAKKPKVEDSPEAKKVVDWIEGNVVMIFSKSYCPFCNKTKDLFKKLKIEFKSIEIDHQPNGEAMQFFLAQRWGQRTVPNVFLRGSHLGGNDFIQTAYKSGDLKTVLEKY